MTVQLKKGQVLGVLSMTPMIDVVFLLLIFFLVASRLSQEDRELDIPLPSASNAMPMIAEPKELVVNVDQRGQIYVNNQRLELEQFEKMIAKQATDNPIGQAVIIRADRRVPLQSPIDVMNACKQHGVVYSLSISEDKS